MTDSANIKISTNITILEDGKKLYVTQNHINPINFSLIIGRALTNMQNGNIFEMGFGNGGHSLNIPLNPKVANWNDTLYNEVYTEIVDVTSGLIGYGDGAVPENDPPSELFSSGPGATLVENTDSTSIIFRCDLNQQEPLSQLDYVVDSNLPTNNYFGFNEIGLFSKGLQLVPTSGYQDVDVGGVDINTKPGLNPNTQYSFRIEVDGRGYNIIFSTPNTNVDVTMEDIVNKINNVFVVNGIPAECLVTDLTSNNIISTYGFLRFKSNTLGGASSINIKQSTVPNAPPYIVSAMAGVLKQPVNGTNAGVRLSSTNSSTEARRMVTHLILPTTLHKASNKSYTIVYEIKIKTESNL